MDSKQRKLDDIAKKARKLRKDSEFRIYRMSFSPIEQELINRVLRSVITQMTNKGDIATAHEILSKTNWIRKEKNGEN